MHPRLRDATPDDAETIAAILIASKTDFVAAPRRARP